MISDVRDDIGDLSAETFLVTGAHVFNLHGETASIADIIAEIERARPEARGQISFDETPLPIPAEFDDAAIRAAFGPLPSTPLADGVRATVERFAELQREGLLDTIRADE